MRHLVALQLLFPAGSVYFHGRFMMGLSDSSEL